MTSDSHYLPKTNPTEIINYLQMAKGKDPLSVLNRQDLCSAPEHLYVCDYIL